MMYHLEPTPKSYKESAKRKKKTQLTDSIYISADHAIIIMA
jgi:hypothetical protein